MYFEIIIQEHSTNIAQIIPSVEQDDRQSYKYKTKALNDFFCYTSKRILKQFQMNVSLVTLYQNCSNRFPPLNNMPVRPINRKELKTTSAAKPVDFETISQEGSLGEPLPKLLKTFCSDE